MPDVTDAQCKAVTDARTAKPAVAARIDALQRQMRDPNADRQALTASTRTAYTELGVDAMVARLEIVPEVRWLHTASFSFSSSVREWAVPLSAGGTGTRRRARWCGPRTRRASFSSST